MKFLSVVRLFSWKNLFDFAEFSYKLKSNFEETFADRAQEKRSGDITCVTTELIVALF